MAHLYKQALMKGKPPKPEKEENEDDDEDEDEEEKDNFNADPNAKFNIDIKKPAKPTGTSKKVTDYSPIPWTDYYDDQEFMENGTPLYRAGHEGIILFCMHGAGDSSLSFACLAKECKQFAQVIGFDFRGHGDSKVQENNEDFSSDTLLNDAEQTLNYVHNRYPDQTIIIIGHSMGGAIAAKLAERVNSTDLKPIIQGIIIIDVVEGTAIEALPFMESIVMSRPKSFKTIEDAIKYSWQHNIVKSQEACRVSVPAKVVKVEENSKSHYEWKVDLLKSEKYWHGWYKGLSKAFLENHFNKQLYIAEKERMDKDLTMAHMQGKFHLVVIADCGHYVQEDNFVETAKKIHYFISHFKLPLNMTEMEELKKLGVWKFKSALKPYEPTKK